MYTVRIYQSKSGVHTYKVETLEKACLMVLYLEKHAASKISCYEIEREID